MSGSALSLWRLAWEGLLDLVYPPRCLICETPGASIVCEGCADSFTAIPEPICSTCGRPRDDAPCRSCAFAAANGGWPYEAARAAGIYEGPLRHALHRLKYGRIDTLAEPLGAYLANRCVVDELFDPHLFKQISAIVPMPLHPARRRARGFNQSELLARPLAEMLSVPLLAGAVRRQGHTVAQVGLTAEARRRNVSPAMFVVSDAATVAGQSVLLVDDVLTTGTTVSACASALRAAGATRVLVVTLTAGG